MSIPELKWDNCERVSRLCRNIGDKLIVWSNETQDGEIANSEGNTSEPDRAFMQILQDRSLLHDKLFLRSDDKQAQAVSAFLLQYAEEFVIVLSLDTSRDLCEIHVANASMRLKGIRTIGGVEYHQLRLSKCDQHEYLLHPESAVVEKWQAALRKVCLQTRFSESYTELAMIGRGNFAQVYSIQRKSDLKLFATKRFDKKLILKDSFEKKCILYEIRMMQAICHSSILELQELFEGDNYIYTITQLYSGPKLSDVILNEDFVLDDKVVSLICLRLLEALAHLESKQIIHRDLKPDNIVFRNPNDLSQPVLVDLGFATYIKDFAYLFTRCGTPGYVAPEILLDQPYDCKADVFSLGVTLYMLVNRGTNPFISEDYQQLVDNNAMGVVDYTPIEERWLTPLIQQMLEPNPHQRPSAVQLMNAYAHILEKGPEPMTDGSAHSSAARPVPSENFGSSGHEIDELQLSVQKIVGTGEDSQLLPTATKNLELELSQASEAIAVSIPYAAESPEASATELPEAADSG